MFDNFKEFIDKLFSGKQLNFIKLRKEVEIGKNGTQGYMITKGKNKGTII